jgi:hypothetical protein
MDVNDFPASQCLLQHHGFRTEQGHGLPIFGGVKLTFRADPSHAAVYPRSPLLDLAICGFEESRIVDSVPTEILST